MKSKLQKDKKAGCRFLNNRFAFTLAEVLITLGIIGIVAEMTIPTLMHNVQDQVFKTAYKKAYSTAYQVVLQCVGDDSFVPRTDWIDYINNPINFSAFMAKFKVVKYCDGSSTLLSQCWDMSGEKFNSSSSPIDSLPGFIDNSGMVWVQGSSAAAITGDVFVDTNGSKLPNKFGKDRFRFFFVTSDGALGTPGIPSKVAYGSDYTTYDADYCKFPPCYYQKWIIN